MSHAALDAGRFDLSSQNLTLGAPASLLSRVLVIIGVVLLIVSGMMAWGTDDLAMVSKSYLVSFMWILAISLGGLFFTFVQHLTHAGWSVAVRRPAEVLAANLAWIWIFFLPVVYMWLRGDLDALFIWADMEHLRAHNPEEADVVAKKEAYLNTGFFFTRAVVYFVIWAVLGTFFYRMSLKQDSEGGSRITDLLQKVSAPAALLFGLTVTFAAFDWLMSLSPAWFSTIFGVYFFAGTCTAGFSAMILICVYIQRSGRMKGLITSEHYQDLGKLLFAFGMVFWAYIGFSQYMLIWYGNIPEETGWFLSRQVGDWSLLSLALLAGHFIIPFLCLISRWPKRYPLFLMVGAVWMIIFAWLDLYWLVMPVIPEDVYTATSYTEFADAHENASTHLSTPINWSLFLGMACCYFGITLGRLRRHPLLPERDPRLKESLSFENI